MSIDDIKSQLQSELPALLQQDIGFRRWLEDLIRDTAVTTECFDDRFDRVLRELAADREAQARKWDEQNRKWEEQNRKWDEQNRHLDEQNRHQNRFRRAEPHLDEQNRHLDEQNRNGKSRTASGMSKTVSGKSRTASGMSKTVSIINCSMSSGRPVSGRSRASAPWVLVGA